MLGDIGCELPRWESVARSRCRARRRGGRGRSGVWRGSGIGLGTSGIEVCFEDGAVVIAVHAKLGCPDRVHGDIQAIAFHW